MWHLLLLALLGTSLADFQEEEKEFYGATVPPLPPVDVILSPPIVFELPEVNSVPTFTPKPFFAPPPILPIKPMETFVVKPVPIVPKPVFKPEFSPPVVTPQFELPLNTEFISPEVSKPLLFAPVPQYLPPNSEFTAIPVVSPPKPVSVLLKPVFTPPKPLLAPPKPLLAPPKPVYVPPKPVFAPPKPVYVPSKPVFAPPKPVFVYTPPKPVYGAPPVVTKFSTPVEGSQIFQYVDNIQGSKLSTFQNFEKSSDGVESYKTVEFLDGKKINIPKFIPTVTKFNTDYSVPSFEFSAPF